MLDLTLDLAILTKKKVDKELKDSIRHERKKGKAELRSKGII